MRSNFEPALYVSEENKGLVSRGIDGWWENWSTMAWMIEGRGGAISDMISSRASSFFSTLTLPTVKEEVGTTFRSLDGSPESRNAWTMSDQRAAVSVRIFLQVCCGK